MTKPKSFRRQLFTWFSVGASALALAVSFLFAWLSSSDIEDLYVSEGLQATQNFADASELALLYESGENAVEAASAALAFPSINHVFLVDLHNQVILQKGSSKTRPVMDPGSAAKIAGTEVVYENNLSWFYAAPVFSSSNEDYFIEEQIISDSGESLTGIYEDGTVQPPSQQVKQNHKGEFLGYVLVAQNKQHLRQIQLNIFSKNLLIGLLYGIAVIAMLHFALKQLLRPMDSLAQAMEKTQHGDIHKIDDWHGPLEIQQMTQVYNVMLDAIADRDNQLRMHNEKLEALVEKRTEELVIARDEALDASKQKSIFLANVSHELRTPLQSIIGYSDVIKESLEDEGIEEFSSDIDRVTHNAQHLLTLINSILDLAKLESGKTNLLLQDTDLNTLLRQAEASVAPLVSNNNNTLNMITQGLKQNVRIDSTKLLQVIINLLSNAAKFTENGTITLYAELTPKQLTIAVEDSGIGIEKAQQAMVFTPFRQVDGSFTRKFEGTGLGLSICKYFCTLMGGRLSLVSEINQGSTFTVTIPLPIDCED
jgi:signal transduction histidine kinase